MRGKVAKELRRLASDICGEGDSAIALAYEPWSPPTYELIGGFTVKTKKGIPKRMNKECVRFFYKYLKKSSNKKS